jgi:hypothetical protein
VAVCISLQHTESLYVIHTFGTQDDGEMYDEFGNLKKKFRAKAQQPEATGQSIPGSGRAGWEVEVLGIYLFLSSFILSNMMSIFPIIVYLGSVLIIVGLYQGKMGEREARKGAGSVTRKEKGRGKGIEAEAEREREGETAIMTEKEATIMTVIATEIASSKLLPCPCVASISFSCSCYLFFFFF